LDSRFNGARSKLREMIRFNLHWLVTCFFAFSGCAPYPGVFFSEHTHFGIQVKVNPKENKPLDVNLGYDRGVFTVVPRTAKDRDASSLISKTDLCVRLIESSVIRNVYASGNAAKQITTDASRVSALFNVNDPNKPSAQPAAGSCE